ncbi:hypothetical protein KSF_108630 [Reticulibacter mediterranei]|uniref:HNH endonuclease n=1 Tax=Reticulibacter mediterranei TaxID=2778369 RepID=A0A8J3J1Y2_9CHLR|nr:hypothetical protein [Reticulibacter mediterranei]GHP00816.1 hypothetical protein KSF_108630 [Reticulibacter mediterranei]
MATLALESKSLMLAPICDGDQIAAALLDYLYLYFQIPSPYELFFRTLERNYTDVISPDFYQYFLKDFQAPFNLDYERYPDTWLSMTLAELHDAMRRQFTWGSDLSREDLIEGLKLLQNKGYLSLEDWDLFEDGLDQALQSEYHGVASPVITCWLYRTRVDAAVTAYYSNQVVTAPIDERIDVKREKRIVNSQVHRARRIGQAASLTFEEWVETLRQFNLCCAFCQTGPYEVLEHFLPIIHGGSSSSFNCLPACEICNALKNERLPQEFAGDIGEERLQMLQHYLEQRRQQWLQKRQQE